jgi:hypothetical protein
MWLCRSLPDDTREQLQDMLHEAETASSPAEAAAIEARVKDKALKALEGRLRRPMQVRRVECVHLVIG